MGWSERPRPALAPDGRPVRHLGLGDHAPADAGGGGDPLLCALDATVSGNPFPGRGLPAGSIGRLGRAGVLHPRPAAAQGRPGSRRPSRRPPSLSSGGSSPFAWNLPLSGPVRLGPVATPP